MEGKKVVFENESVSSLSSTLSKGNTGSVPVLLQAAIGFGPALVLNEILAKREAYRSARTRFLEGQKERAYDAFVDGVWFPVPTKEIYASTGYEISTISRYIDKLIKNELISISQKKAKLNAHNHDQIRHIRIADDIDEKLVTIAKRGYDTLLARCPELAAEVMDGRQVAFESLLWSINHRCHTINRFLVHTLGSAEITALYNYITTISIQKRTEKHGAFKVDYNYFCARFDLSRNTLDKHINHLDFLNVIKKTVSHRKGTFVEVVTEGDIFIKQAINYGMIAYDQIDEWEKDFKRSFGKLKEHLTTIKNSFENIIKNELPKSLIDKMEAAQKIIEDRDVAWGNSLQEAKDALRHAIQNYIGKPLILSSQEQFSSVQLFKKFSDFTSENYAHLIAYLANYGHTIYDRPRYIITSICQNSDENKTISEEDIVFLRNLN